MYNMIKKIEYCIVQILYHELDSYTDEEFGINFTTDNDVIIMELGIKPNYTLELSDVFCYKKINSFRYKIYKNTRIRNILEEDTEELFVKRYKNSLQELESVLLYLCIDNENDYIFNEYKPLLKNKIQSIINK